MKPALPFLACLTAALPDGNAVNDDGADFAARCAFALSAALIVAGLALLWRTGMPFQRTNYL